MDSADLAQRREEMDRAVALRTVLMMGGAWVAPRGDGPRHCLSCGEMIAPSRLAAHPGAVRCLGCQGRWELGR